MTNAIWPAADSFPGSLKMASYKHLTLLFDSKRPLRLFVLCPLVARLYIKSLKWSPTPSTPKHPHITEEQLNKKAQISNQILNVTVKGKAFTQMRWNLRNE